MWVIPVHQIKMNIIFFVPHLNTIYAGRTIYNGYKNAFVDLGHNFRFLTADDNQEKVYEEFQPQIIFTSMNPYVLKFLSLEVLKKQKRKGLKVFVNVPFWTSPFSKMRVNESSSLSQNKEYVKLIKSGDFGDVYYNISEKNDPRMEGFEKGTGYKQYTIPLAADKTINYPEYSEKFKSDISFLGTNLPGKRAFFQKNIFPLKKKHDVKFYGQDWTKVDRFKGNAQKIGQYFNIPLLKDIQKPKFELEDERRIYNSSTISINVHEDHQKKYGTDCNERTFKIPISGGFEIVDNIACIKKYFVSGKEIIIAESDKDWLEKIDYYMKYPDKRLKIIEAGRTRVLRDHTYHQRIGTLLEIYKSL